MNKSFDVFLSHNSKDKPAVRELAEALRARGLEVWLDEWELVPGQPWQEALEEVIETTGSSAVLVGRDGLGPWHTAEMRGCLTEFVRRKLPVIPVLLPGAPAEPRLPLFLTQVTWVDLRNGLTEEGLDQLQWGITRKRPDRSKRPSIPTAAPEAAVAAAEAQPASAKVKLAPFEVEAPTVSATERSDQKARVLRGVSPWIGLLTLLVIAVFLLDGYHPRADEPTQQTPAQRLPGPAEPNPLPATPSLAQQQIHTNPQTKDAAAPGRDSEQEEVESVYVVDGAPLPLPREVLRQNLIIQQRLGILYETAREALQRANKIGKLTKGEILDVKEIMANSLHNDDEQHLSLEVEKQLDNFAEQINDRDDVYIEIQGHTDSMSRESYSQALGLTWAKSVQQYLTSKHGFPLERTIAVSYGGLVPVADNSSAEGRSQNRRLVLVVLR